VTPERARAALVVLVLATACSGGAVRHQSPSATHRTAPHAAASEQVATISVHRRIVIGHSVRGVPIHATELGDPTASHTLLVVGVIHGNETAGLAVIHRLLRSTPPPDVDLWLVPTMNPDGERAGTRQNAHGVDLNRNFPYRWKPYEKPWDPYYSGPRAASERETRTSMRFIRRIRPEVSIWYHQHEHAVIKAPGRIEIEARYAKLVGLPFNRHYPFAPGRATYWQHAHVPGSTAFVVEFGAGSLTPQVARRHARAVLAIARMLAVG
jgi:protein MpaA